MNITSTTTAPSNPKFPSVMLFIAYKAVYTGTARVAFRPKLLMTPRQNAVDIQVYLANCTRAGDSLELRLRDIATNLITPLVTIQLPDRVVYEDMEHQGGTHIMKNFDMRGSIVPLGTYNLNYIQRNAQNVTAAVSLAQGYTIS